MSNTVEMKVVPRESAFQQNQRIARQMPGILRGLHEEIKTVTDIVASSEAKQSKQLDVAKQQALWTERLHDRMDALIAETRVTNLLLAELVALQQSVISEPVDALCEDIRHEAYVRVSNGG